MSFLYHEPCPRCRKQGKDKSGNNLAVYADGHTYCFSCGRYTPASIEAKLAPPKEQITNPYMFSRSESIPKPALVWLKQYGLTNTEISANYFWDNSGYLVFDGGKYQCGRNFTNAGAKYCTKGLLRGNEKLFTTGENSGTIVVVEDHVSAIKVGRVENAVALSNAVIPLELLQSLSERFSTLVIWLDPDKQKESLTEASKASIYFDRVKVVFSSLDPKAMEMSEIKEKLFD